MSREIKTIINDLVSKGWSIKKGTAHYRAYHQKGGIVTISATPSDGRAIKNILADVKRLERKHDLVPV